MQEENMTDFSGPTWSTVAVVKPSIKDSKSKRIMNYHTGAREVEISAGFFEGELIHDVRYDAKNWRYCSSIL